jgi:hypothetical protein
VHLRKELCCEFRRNRIIEDSESSARWALSKCIGAQEEDRTVERSVEKKEETLPGGHRVSVQTGTEEKNSLSSGSWRKNPLKDLHWVAEHPERLSKRLLEQKDSRKALNILHLWEKKDKIP